ncbi:hypothetical protein N7488_000197 [Penicillium malachiteum]|nr:hypothetical protein N7488_000197 [Penicillium malachiteum]
MHIVQAQILLREEDQALQVEREVLDTRKNLTCSGHGNDDNFEQLIVLDDEIHYPPCKPGILVVMPVREHVFMAFLDRALMSLTLMPGSRS